MRIARAFVALILASGVATTVAAAPSNGLSLEQIRNVMRANAVAFNGCLTAATRRNPPLHGPFLYEIEVDPKGRVTAVRPHHPSEAAAFDKCITGVLKRAKFPGGPAHVEAPLVFDPS
jgi:hypothetical protein